MFIRSFFKNSSNNISNRTTGDRTHCRAGDNGDLGRPATAAPRNGDTDIHEELIRIHALKHRTECEEAEQQRGCHTGQRAEHTLGGHVGLLHKFCEGNALIFEHGRAVRAKKCVRSKCRASDAQPRGS